MVIGIFITRLYHRASKEVAFVRTGAGGEKVVMNGGALVLPVFNETMPVNMNTVRLAVERKQRRCVDHAGPAAGRCEGRVLRPRAAR